MHLQEALDNLHYIIQMGIEIELHTYASFLQACASKKVLQQAKYLHSLILCTRTD